MSFLSPGPLTSLHRPTRPRLFAVDVDGTLLTSHHTVTDAVRDAVETARERGSEVLLTTSRPPRALWPILEFLGLLVPAAFIGSQGGLVGSYSPEGHLVVLERRPMPLDLARDAVAAASRAGLAVNWFSGEEWFVSEMDDQVRREAEIVACEPVVTNLATLTAPPEKLLVIAPPGRAADLEDIVTALSAGVRAQTSNPTYLEITASAVDKAAALRDFCAGRGIAPEAVVAIGDGMNDLGMFRFAGTAVAPANARPEVRAAAHLITTSNDEDGVAHALEELSVPG